MAKHKQQSGFESSPSFESSYDPPQSIESEPPKIFPSEEQKANNNLLNGLNDIENAPKDGTNIILMKDENDPGLMCYWRKTRSRKEHQWTTGGIWSHTLSRFSITFEPKYWREADAVISDLDPSIIDKARIVELEQKIAELSRGR